MVPPSLTGTAIEQWRQTNWKRVTVVAEFRRNGFLDYGYFTDKEGQEVPVDFTPTKSGKDQKVEFVLYDVNSEQVFQSIFLVIDVE